MDDARATRSVPNIRAWPEAWLRPNPPTSHDIGAIHPRHADASGISQVMSGPHARLRYRRPIAHVEGATSPGSETRRWGYVGETGARLRWVRGTEPYRGPSSMSGRRASLPGACSERR
jgi:hypothetical protein